MNEILHRALLEVQKAVKTSQPATGICDIVSKSLLNLDPDTSLKVRIKLDGLMRKWPEYSGDAIFPVPAPEDGCPETCYLRASPAEMWGYGDYGRARRRLLVWLIEKTQHTERTEA